MSNKAIINNYLSSFQLLLQDWINTWYLKERGDHAGRLYLREMEEIEVAVLKIVENNQQPEVRSYSSRSCSRKTHYQRVVSTSVRC